MTRFFDPNPTHRPILYRIHGPDALDYLHRLTTSNVQRLEISQCAPGLFLNAQGKIKCAFILLRVAPEDFFMEVESPPLFPVDLPGLIEEFRFAEKFQVERVPGECRWYLDGDSDQDDKISNTPDQIVLTHDFQALGTPWISLWRKDSAFRRGTPLTLEEWELLRIKKLFPRWGHEITTEANPLEVHLVSAIAENKGCYPGQEVVEKIISLGSSARRLCLIEFSSPPSPTLPREILSATDGGVVGKLTSTLHESPFALGVLRKTEAQAGKTVLISGPHSSLPGTIREVA